MVRNMHKASAVPVPLVFELDPRESFEAHVQYFGLEYQQTEPLPLPDTIELVAREEDVFADTLRRAGLSIQDARALSELWAHERGRR